MSGERVKLTKVQQRVLERAAADGAIELTGLDKTPNVRCDVVGRLEDMGLLRWDVGRSDLGGHHPRYRLTDAGVAALSPAGDRS